MTQTKPIIFRLALLVTAGCDESAPTTSRFDSEKVEFLSSVSYENGTEIEFFSTNDGVPIVSELVTVGEFSPLDYLRAEYGSPTPLEVFLALEIDEDPPAELLIHHDELMATRGREDEVRQMTLPPEGARYGMWNMDADCTFAEDNAWFDDYADDESLDWRRYYNGQATGVNDTDSLYTNKFMTHVCNYGVPQSGGNAQLYVSLVQDGGEVIGTGISSTGRRKGYWLEGSETWQAHYWNGRSYKWAAASGNYKLGAAGFDY